LLAGEAAGLCVAWYAGSAGLVGEVFAGIADADGPDVAIDVSSGFGVVADVLVEIQGSWVGEDLVALLVPLT